MTAKLNPLTWVFLLVVTLFLVFRSESLIEYAWLAAGLSAVVFSANLSLKSIFSRLRPILLFLPFMFFFYMVMSLLFAETAFGRTVETVVVSGVRILLMVFSMAMFLELTGSMKILDALRSLWRATRISSRTVEDGFQLLYLTFRFFPMLKEEIQAISQLEKALGLPPRPGRFSHIRRTAYYLPGLISNSLQRADNLAVAIQTRKYGQVLPRGLANPVGFHAVDTLFFALAVLFIAGHVSLA